MDSIEITLITEEHGSVIIPLYLGEEETFSGGDCVFNDEVYTFSISSGYGFPTKLFVNEDCFETEIYKMTSNTFSFRPLLKSQKSSLFRECFGTVCIKLEIQGRIYSSKA